MDLIPGEHKQSSSEGPPHRSTNQEHKHGSSCPVHGHGTTTGPSPPSSSSEPVRSHSSHARADPALMPNIARPGEYKRMFLPPHEVPMIHPYLVHPPRDAPYPIHPLDERHAEFMRERERQVCLCISLIYYHHQHGVHIYLSLLRRLFMIEPLYIYPFQEFFFTRAPDVGTKRPPYCRGMAVASLAEGQACRTWCGTLPSATSSTRAHRNQQSKN